MRWPWQRAVQERSVSVSISDPAFASYFGLGSLLNFSGVQVSEHTALGLSAVWRAVSLISETLASLPMPTLRLVDGRRETVASFLDDPGGPDGLTPFEWREMVLVHLLLHGNAYLMHVFNGGGGLAGLTPVHPLAVTVDWNGEAPGGKTFKATLRDGTTHTFDAETMTQIMGKSLDGLQGLSPIAIARNSLGTAVAGDRAAARQFANGGMIAGLVTPEEDVTEGEAKTIKDGLNAKIAGWEHAGEIAVVNRKLKFTPWMLSSVDAQFLESRQFSIEEVSRWYGIPPFALMQTEKQTSWGQGIEAQQRGLARQVLGPWSTRIEQKLSRLLPSPRFVETDFSELERPTPESEISLLIQQVGAGLMTPNEARSKRNLPPIAGGDALRVPGAAQGAPDAPELPEVVE